MKLKSICYSYQSNNFAIILNSCYESNYNIISKNGKFKVPLQKHRDLAIDIIKTFTGIEKDVLHDDYGMPYLQGNNWNISISHSEGLVAVIFDSQKVTGVDIQVIRDNIASLKNKFMSDQEIEEAAINYYANSSFLHVYWGAKETLYKIYSKGQLNFKKDLYVHPFVYNGKGVITAEIIKKDYQRIYYLWYEKIEQSILVYLMND